MTAAVLQHQFSSLLAGPLAWQAQPTPDLVPTGIADIDAATGGLPRGTLTATVAPASSGRTSLLHCRLAAAAAPGITAMLRANEPRAPSTHRRRQCPPVSAPAPV